MECVGVKCVPLRDLLRGERIYIKNTVDTLVIEISEGEDKYINEYVLANVYENILRKANIVIEDISSIKRITFNGDKIMHFDPVFVETEDRKYLYNYYGALRYLTTKYHRITIFMYRDLSEGETDNDDVFILKIETASLNPNRTEFPIHYKVFSMCMSELVGYLQTDKVISDYFTETKGDFPIPENKKEIKDGLHPELLRNCISELYEENKGDD